MNFALYIQNIYLKNIFFLESKSNIVVKGEFTKMIYSHAYFSLNGIYIICPFPNTISNKSTFIIDPLHNENRLFISQIRNFENNILNYYKKMFNCNKKNRIVLTTQLENGWMRFYNDNLYNPNKHSKINYILKISGIWETINEIGITYKLLQCVSI
jgi:hypothetical protein